jgi:acylaminoacyl-peptidase
MVTTSDIPDWCAVECGIPYDFSRFEPPSEASLLRMRAASPLLHVHKVTSPTLVCLGGQDRRVPPSQGTEYHHLLRSAGVVTKLLIFPEDRHAIDRPATEAEQHVAIARWIKAYTLSDAAIWAAIAAKVFKQIN